MPDIVMADRDFADGTRITTVKQPGGTRDVLLQLDGQRISRVVIIPMLMRVGAAVLRMDGVGGVETVEGFRNRGYSRRVMETVLEQIKAGDASLSTLFGIQDFYQKFGYDTAGPELTVILPEPDNSELAPTIPKGWLFRPLTERDLPAVMSLYNVNIRRATGAIVRHDAGEDATETERLTDEDSDARKIGFRAWNRLRRLIADPGEDACRVLLDAAGRVAAYAWFGANWWMGVRRRDLPAAFHLAEVMARDPESADALLAACRLWAAEASSDYDAVAFAIPPEGPVASAVAYQGADVRAVFTRGGDFMGRVLDTSRLIRQLLPELTGRVCATPPAFQGLLTIATDEGQATIAISPRGVSLTDGYDDGDLVIELPQSALARLCIGGFDPADVLARLPQPPEEALASLLCLLFPKRTPHIYPMDRF
jgi:hypothetical protein